MKFACGKTRIGFVSHQCHAIYGFIPKGIESLGFTCVSPDADGQKKVMESIYSFESWQYSARTKVDE